MMQKEFKLTDDFPPVSYQQWRELVDADLKGAPFDKKLVTALYEGIALQPLYTAEHWDGAQDPSGFPGTQPFVRGGRPLGRGWAIRQVCANPDLEAAAREIQTDLERGCDAIELRLDRAARAGLDSDQPAAAGLAGQGGLMVASMADLSHLLEDADLAAHSVALQAGAAFLPSAALLAALLQRQGGENAPVAFNADPLGAVAAEGQVAGSIPVALAQMAELAAWTGNHLPGSTSIQVSTAVYHDAGATAVQELALAMATAVAYLRALTDAGMSLDAACAQIDFSFSVGTQFFMEIAKLRAARQLWGRVTEAAGAAQAMRLNATTGLRELTQRDPWVNFLRATVGCFAGAVAGAESITVSAFDERLGVPGKLGRRVARNTQIVLKEESHLDQVIDPAGGCWFLESLTAQLAEEAWKLFQEVERQGGMAAALTSGWVAGQIDVVQAQRVKNQRKRKDPVTGVSEFPNLNEKLPEREPLDIPALVGRASERLTARRGQDGGAAALAKVRELAGRSAGPAGTLMELLVAAAAAGATLGSLGQALGNTVTGVQAPLPVRPLAQPFEALRDASDAWLASHGQRPRVFLANLGPVAQHTGRATWSHNFFEAGGFEVLTNTGFDTPAAAAAAFKASGAAIAVVCSSDALYATLVTEVVPALKQAGARSVVLAGHPGENREAWTQAGVDHYIHLGCDVAGTLETLLKEEGVLS